jgi:F0F1-type ATP synthase membrane subunit b/b'
MASHTTCNAALIDALKQLKARWSRVRDDAAAKFEKEVIDPLEPAIARAVRAIEQAGELMQQAKRDCGDD